MQSQQIFNFAVGFFLFIIFAGLFAVITQVGPDPLRIRWRLVTPIIFISATLFGVLTAINL